jgi:hypothetical protein
MQRLRTLAGLLTACEQHSNQTTVTLGCLRTVVWPRCGEITCGR